MKVRVVLDTWREPQPKIAMHEEKAIQNPKWDKSITILAADKGNATVVLHHTEYSIQIDDVIQKGGYQILHKNSTTTI